MVTKVVMPPLGDSSDEAKVLKWHIHEGAAVQRGAVLLDIETDKVQMEIEAYGSGVLRKILIAEGTTVPVGTSLAVIAEPDDDISAYVR